MRDIYIQGSEYKLSLLKESLIIKNEHREIVDEIGIDSISNLIIFGQSQLTTQLIKRLSLKQVNIFYFTMEGRYLSMIDSNRDGDFEKQEAQARAHFNSDFRIEIARKMISAKIRNQINLLKSFDEDQILDSVDYHRLTATLDGVAQSESIHEMMGFEGRSAKSYFYFLSLLVPDQYYFSGRSRQPAKDGFNSLLNFGYSILYSFFIGMIRKAGLNQGFGMIHECHGHHASLASDLMEEWRPVIVDDLVMGLLRNGELTQDDFITSESQGVLLSKKAQQIFLKGLSSRMLEIHAYREKDRKRYTFIYMIEMQLHSLIQAFKESDPSLYLSSFTGE